MFHSQKHEQLSGCNFTQWVGLSITIVSAPEKDADTQVATNTDVYTCFSLETSMIELTL